ncbi:hypothetical protein NPIL_587081 [Nephila pilipes]|uniref:Uncharacterized protein n=1 Tax=Nephila pilipes TaxID=299642 RepID=A0A8X6TKC6_NEPPI|nr:hypothetical protein NPIL_587081 [Nephila pilipes]
MENLGRKRHLGNIKHLFSLLNSSTGSHSAASPPNNKQNSGGGGQFPWGGDAFSESGDDELISNIVDSAGSDRHRGIWVRSSFSPNQGDQDRRSGSWGCARATTTTTVPIYQIRIVWNISYALLSLTSGLIDRSDRGSDHSSIWRGGFNMVGFPPTTPGLRRRKWSDVVDLHLRRKVVSDGDYHHFVVDYMMTDDGDCGTLRYDFVVVDFPHTLCIVLMLENLYILS